MHKGLSLSLFLFLSKLLVMLLPYIKLYTLYTDAYQQICDHTFKHTGPSFHSRSAVFLSFVVSLRGGREEEGGREGETERGRGGGRERYTS